MAFRLLFAMVTAAAPNPVRGSAAREPSEGRTITTSGNGVAARRCPTLACDRDHDVGLRPAARLNPDVVVCASGVRLVLIGDQHLLRSCHILWRFAGFFVRVAR